MVRPDPPDDFENHDADWDDDEPDLEGSWDDFGLDEPDDELNAERLPEDGDFDIEPDEFDDPWN